MGTLYQFFFYVFFLKNKTKLHLSKGKEKCNLNVLDYGI